MKSQTMMMKQTFVKATAFTLLMAGLAGCGGGGQTAGPSPQPTVQPAASASAASPTAQPSASSAPATPSVSPPAKSPQASAKPAASSNPPKSGEDPNAVQVVAKPDSITALVNKQYVLPKEYEPKDLVYPDVPFTFKEKIEKRKMRKEAAEALEKLFAGAKKDGIQLAGVSAYRSYATQAALYNSYVKKDGEAKARTYSAPPGSSEHETGLAIDVSGSDGKCAAQDCFGGTKEAKWLEEHAAEYGFIIRFPKGKESITGYQYEPWHIRYVGSDVAAEIVKKGITLEEYAQAVPVSK